MSINGVVVISFDVLIMFVRRVTMVLTTCVLIESSRLCSSTALTGSNRRTMVMRRA